MVKAIREKGQSVRWPWLDARSENQLSVFDDDRAGCRQRRNLVDRAVACADVPVNGAPCEDDLRFIVGPIWTIKSASRAEFRNA